MKCQKCEKPATFHITDLTSGSTVAHHLCSDCAKIYLKTTESEIEAPTATGIINQQMKLEQTAEELKELDGRVCPMCGISFYEFRQSGRLGCPHDYTFFGNELEPLLVNVHGDNRHTGKHPLQGDGVDMESQTELIRLRREMKEVVESEQYEEATRIRDTIRKIEQESQKS